MSFFFFLTIHSALATCDFALMKYLMQTIPEETGGILFLDFTLANPSAWRSLPSLKNEGNALGACDACLYLARMGMKGP